jgi:hypothetical protein
LGFISGWLWHLLVVVVSPKALKKPKALFCQTGSYWFGFNWWLRFQAAVIHPAVNYFYWGRHFVLLLYASNFDF